jgi:hypothetical protein
MVVDDQVKGKEQANYRNNIGKKRNSCQPLPGTFLHHVLGACSLEIGIGCNKGRAKCKQSQEVTNLSYEQMLPVKFDHVV